MDTAMQRERLTEIFDHVVRDITQREAGIVLHSSQTQLEGELCTVCTTPVCPCARRSPCLSG